MQDLSSLDLVGAGFLDHVHLTSGNGGGGDKGAVLGPDEGQVAFGGVGTVFSSLKFALEATYPGDAL